MSEDYENLLEEYNALTEEDAEEILPTGAVRKDQIQYMVMIAGILAGLSWTQIAKDMGLRRRKLYELRQSLEFHKFINALVDEQLQDITTLKASGELVDAMKFRNQLIQAITPRMIRQKVQADVKTEIVFTIEEPDDAKNPDEVEASPETT